jgi:hypothetical protein
VQEALDGIKDCIGSLPSMLDLNASITGEKLIIERLYQSYAMNAGVSSSVAFQDMCVLSGEFMMGNVNIYNYSSKMVSFFMGKTAHPFEAYSKTCPDHSNSFLHKTLQYFVSKAYGKTELYYIEQPDKTKPYYCHVAMCMNGFILSYFNCKEHSKLKHIGKHINSINWANVKCVRGNDNSNAVIECKDKMYNIMTADDCDSYGYDDNDCPADITDECYAYSSPAEEKTVATPVVKQEKKSIFITEPCKIKGHKTVELMDGRLVCEDCLKKNLNGNYIEDLDWGDQESCPLCDHSFNSDIYEINREYFICLRCGAIFTTTDTEEESNEIGMTVDELFSHPAGKQYNRQFKNC